MDPRHVSLEIHLFNQIISFINTYREEHLDEMMLDEKLLAEIKNICTLIYSCVHLWRDMNTLLSKKNLLSIDTVPLTLISTEAVIDQREFANAFYQLKVIAEKNDKPSDFYTRFSGYIKDYLADKK